MFKNYLEIKQTNTGKGVFTKIDIPARKPIIEVTGEVHSENTMPQPENPAWLQVSNKWFVGPSGSLDDQVRHSCNPNAYLEVVGTRAILYSLYLIKAGSEVTFDYSLTSTDTLDKWKLDCKCNFVNCRKTISGWQYLPEDLKEKYRKMNIVPMFMENPMFRGK